MIFDQNLFIVHWQCIQIFVKNKMNLINNVIQKFNGNKTQIVNTYETILTPFDIITDEGKREECSSVSMYEDTYDELYVNDELLQPVSGYKKYPVIISMFIIICFTNWLVAIQEKFFLDTDFIPMKFNHYKNTLCSAEVKSGNNYRMEIMFNYSKYINTFFFSHVHIFKEIRFLQFSCVGCFKLNEMQNC